MFIPRLVIIETQDGSKKRRIQIDPEDLIAGAAALVAVIFAISVVAGWLELNRYTAGIIACSGAGTVIAKIAKSRSQSRKREPRLIPQERRKRRRRKSA
jgi:hypothetical protein